MEILLFSEFARTVERSGKELAEQIYKMMMGNYKRLTLINTGQYELEKYREYTRRTAEQFGLHFEEIEGSTALTGKGAVRNRSAWGHLYIRIILSRENPWF